MIRALCADRMGVWLDSSAGLARFGVPLQGIEPRFLDTPTRSIVAIRVPLSAGTFVICLHYHTDGTGFHAITCACVHQVRKATVFQVQNFSGGVFEAFSVNI